MESLPPIAQRVELPDRQQAALLTLLADEDASVYQAVREKFFRVARSPANGCNPIPSAAIPCFAAARRV